MNIDEILSLVRASVHLRYPESAYSEVAGRLSVDGKVALPLYPVCRSIVGGPDIEVVDSTGSNLGYLSLTSRLGTSDPSDYTDVQYVAYITECGINQAGAEYFFRRDYLVLENSVLELYLKEYQATSGLWGGFEHVIPPERHPLPATNDTLSIEARSKLKIPTLHHAEALFLATRMPFAFERYLKLYHMLELSFDLQVVDEVKALGADLRGVGELLSNLGAKELDRLRWILSRRLVDYAPLVAIVNSIPCSSPLAKKIFFDHEKSGNPLKWDDFEDMWTGGGVDYISFKKVRRGATSDSHNKFIVDLVSYWIYRLRCCIAHSRIGEFVLQMGDESFLMDFGEPLIKEVLFQVCR